MRRRTWLALALSGFLVVLLTPAWGSAQSVVTAQILDFFRLLSVGGTFSGVTLSYSDLSIVASGYANFGTTLGTNGYGIRDNAGTIQIKNSGGSWTTPAGGASASATYLVQTSTNAPGSAQVLGSLTTGLLVNTTVTGVQSIYGGTSCTNQFPRSLSALGVATCATVNLASDVTGNLAATSFPALTGDITTAGGALATTLATVNSNTGSFGTSTAIPVITVNGKGLITAVTTTAPQLTLTSTYFSSLAATNLTGIPGANITGTLATVAVPAFTGDVTSAGGALALTVGKIGGVSVTLGGALSTVGANTLAITTTGNTAITLPTSGTLISSTVTALSSLVSVSTLTVGTWNATPITAGYGGLGLSTITAHDIIVGNGTGTATLVGGCSGGALYWTASSSDPTCQVSPVFTSPGSTTSSVLGGTAVAGAAATQVRKVYQVTGIPDATSSPLFTVTVPNGAEGGSLSVRILGHIGAGGAVGADECTATLSGVIAIARTSGAATVPTAASASTTTSSCVAGATTITLAYAVSALTGANGVTQTFTVNATITKGGGSSTNHVAEVLAELINQNASGITLQ